MSRFVGGNSIDLTWTAVVDSSEVLLSLPSRVSGLIVSDNSCNDLTELDLNRFENLRRMSIGESSLLRIEE